MTIQWGDTGRVVTGTLKNFTITLATPRETLSGTPTALPSTNPGSASAQATFTVQASDLPTISPSPISTSYTAMVFIGGKNTDAASQTVNYQVYKNGTAIGGASGSQSVPSNNFWTQSHYRFPTVAVGDTLAVSVWSASANVNFDYIAIIVLPTQTNLGKSYLNKDVTYSNPQRPTLSSGTPTVRVNSYFAIYPCDSTTQNITPSSTVKFGGFTWNATYFVGRVNAGDLNTGSDAVSHATARPYYTTNYIPSSISFREVLR